MSNSVLVLGNTGTGKSYAATKLDPAETYWIQCIPKIIPVKGWKKLFPIHTKDNPDGRRFISDNSSSIVTVASKVAAREDVSNIVLDDFNYLMSNEFMRRSLERGFDKFTDIGKHAFEVLDCLMNLPDIYVWVLAHVYEEDGMEKIKTIGKLLDDKVCIEGLFNIVLYTYVEDEKYGFLTQNNGRNTCKSLPGLFDSIKIPNDLQMVREALEAYE